MITGYPHSRIAGYRVVRFCGSTLPPSFMYRDLQNPMNAASGDCRVGHSFKLPSGRCRHETPRRSAQAMICRSTQVARGFGHGCRTRWLGHRPDRQKLQAQSGRDRLAVAELHVEDDGIARGVFDLDAPRRGVVAAGVDDAAREYRPGSDSGRRRMRGAIVSEPNIERLLIAHGGGHILELSPPADEVAREVKALGGRDARRC